MWGNHSPTMFPDLFNAKVKGKNAVEVVDDMAWYENEYLPNVGKRGAAIIEARGASSAASAANAAIDHVHDWVLGADGLRVDGGPVRRLLRRRRGHHLLVPGPRERRVLRDRPGPRGRRLRQSKIDITVGELREERDAVSKLGLV